MSLTVYILYTFSLTVVNFVLIQKDTGNFGDTLGLTWGSCLNVVVCGIFFWPITGLLFFHITILGAGKTTYEYESKQDVFKCMRMVKNVWALVGVDVGKSLIDGRKYVSSTNPLENKPSYPKNISDFTSVRVFENTTLEQKITNK